MKRIVLFLALVGALATNSFAQCSETNQPKVLLIGDSWAFFMNADQTINNAFKKWGHSNFKFVSNSVVAENGAETDDFLQQIKQDEIVSLLNQNPSIEVVHLSIGGNDVLGDWKVSSTQGFTDSLLQNVSERLEGILDFLKAAKPGIKILWSGYVYPNFGEVIADQGILSGNSHPFFGTWDKMEQPTFIQLNNILNRFSDSVLAYTQTDPQVDFIPASGLMQYTFGQTSPLGIAPGGTYPAFSQPLPYGDPNYPSPKGSMRDYLGLTKDCFHLSAKGYADLIEYHTQKYYHKLLMDDLYVIAANNNENGTVSSAGNVANALSLGENAGENFATQLTFNTSAMLDTTLAKASIFIRRESLTGTNPISANLEVTIKNGSFGASANVEPADFSAAGNDAGNPCLFGSNAGDGHWVRLDLPISFYPFIDNNNPVQLRIAAPGFTGGKVTFSGTADPEFAPVLNVKYGTPTVSIDEVDAVIKFSVFPNPVKDQLQIEGVYGDILRLQVVNIFGQQIGVNLLNDRSISTENLPTGNYFISITTKEGSATQRFIKE
jgi:hypothetical protein